MNISQVTYYECANCGTKFTDEDEALSCCYEGEKNGHKCGVCETIYPDDMEEAAELCCSEVQP